MAVVCLFLAIVTGSSVAIIGAMLGQVGWISLGLYMAGGLGGTVLAILARAFSDDGTDTPCTSPATGDVLDQSRVDVTIA
jgi:hypothetical protein